MPMSDGGYEPILLTDTSKLLHEERLEYFKLGLGPRDLATICLDDASQKTGYTSVLGLFLEKVSRRSKDELDAQVEKRVMEKRSKPPVEPELFLFGKNRRPIIDYSSEYNYSAAHRRALEYAMARHLSCRLGAPVYPISELMQHPEYPFLIAKLDFVAVLLNPETGEFDHPVNLQFRTDYYWNKTSLEEEIPLAHELECRTQMLVSGLEETFLLYACDKGEDSIVSCHIPRSLTMEQKLIRCGKQFWCRHVESEILPFPRVPTDTASRDIAMYAESRKQYHRPPEVMEKGMPELVRQYAAYKATVDDRKESLEEAEDVLAAVKLQLSRYMLDRPEAVCGDLKLRWREYKSRSVDWEALELAYPQIYNRFVTEKVTPGFEVRMNKPKKMAEANDDHEAAA